MTISCSFKFLGCGSMITNGNYHLQTLELATGSAIVDLKLQLK